ncbi:putative F-box/FBD/LRR-repeat protein At4g03220 [Benincasa hispida]|uniref:putative F-box/FBD/LRR-repeat protein At4g03220 n=1 Tax=Benincasa hispida TaxID=102211 RepID=UPI00190295C4|nr:putative F-box/FBD/LRR-repeat protein At4g03220 [Benincasa hispida]
METRSARRRRLSNTNSDLHNQTGVDYISHLPDALLHHILCSLPIKTAAQSTTLSSRWRSLWFTLPDLDFSTSSISDHYPSDLTITRILNSRPHHSNVRLLRFSATLSFSRLNALFRTAIRHQIQELHLLVTTNDYFNFPRCVIASDSLKVFNLRSIHPGFRLPPPSVMGSGFRSLNSLSLARMVFHDRPSLLDLFTETSFPVLKKLNLERCFGLEHLSVKCPVLEDFSLQWCFQLQGLDVFGAKLQSIHVSDCFDAYTTPTLVKIVAPNLNTMIWVYNALNDEINIHQFTSPLNRASLGLLPHHFVTSKLHSVSALLSAISPVHSLTLDTFCIDIVSSPSYFAYFFPPFSNVNCLELSTAFRKQNGLGLANIFRSCPVLQTLTIKIVNGGNIGRKDWRRDKWERSGSEEERFWETQIEPLKSFLLHLKIVKIEGFMDCLSEVSLTQFLLKHGSALQQLTLLTTKTKHRDSLIRRREIKSQIMAFPRASSLVKLHYC